VSRSFAGITTQLQTRWTLVIVAIAGFVGCAGAGIDTPPEFPPPDRTARLQHDLRALSADSDPAEARLLAETALARTAVLAARFRMVRPALLHNTLVNVGLKQRGLCWHWTEDLLAELRQLRLEGYDLHWGIAHPGRLFREHNSLIVTARGDALADGLVLDPWRESGTLYWVAVSEDHYPWEPRAPAAERSSSEPGAPSPRLGFAPR
jgi:hypothetical protein